MSGVISVLVIVAVGMMAFLLMGEAASTIPTEGLDPLSANLIGILPLIFMTVIIFSLVAAIGRGTYVATRYLKWTSFGNRLKEAYSAKFGGPSATFNEEVDQHIKAMRALGKGFTKFLDMDWLKRMSAFVEVPFVIPEEEYKPEEEKAREF